MPTFRLDKLVREKLPQIYAELGQQITTRRLSPSEFRDALREKLIEEASEPFDATDDQAVLAELADIQQVLDDLVVQYGFSREQLAAVQQKKLAKKGGFQNAVFVETVTCDDDDPWTAYYRKEPERFPEI